MRTFFVATALGLTRLIVAIIITVRYVPIAQLHLWPSVFMAALTE